LSRRAKKRRLVVHADGAIRDDPPVTGIGVVIRDGQGQVLDWISEVSEGRLTCNEAEYAAMIRALQAAQAYCPCEVHLYLDSLIVVNQMRGRFAVRSPALRRLNAQAQLLVRRFRQVTFTHVRRKRNRLADALANEAVENRDS
jgi:ribonuclease HI